MATPDFNDARRPAIFFVCTGALLLVLLSLSACTSMKAYDGAVRPSDEISVIRPDTDKAFTRVRILEVNDLPVGRFVPGLQVLPGQNTVYVQVTLDHPYLRDFFCFCETLTFETAPGATYTVHGKISPLLLTGYIWVEGDKTPGRVVVESIKTPIRTTTYPHCRTAG